MQNGNSHSSIQPHKPDLILPSDRKFGTIFSGLFALVAIIAFYRAQSLTPAAYIFASLALLMIGLAWLYPKALRPFNVAWMTLGLWLGKIVSPIVLGLIFLLVFTPLALVLRLFGRDELSLRDSPSSTTYWKPRSPEDLDMHGFKNQF
ncbi:AI-2E family transporter [Parasphingorhabdus sp. NYA22]